MPSCFDVTVSGVSGDRIAENKIYEPLDKRFFCFRRLNATHEIGCQCKSRLMSL